MKKAYVFLADGFEEIEGLTVVDVLRRAGAEVEMVSIHHRNHFHLCSCVEPEQRWKWFL